MVPNLEVSLWYFNTPWVQFLICVMSVSQETVTPTIFSAHVFFWLHSEQMKAFGGWSHKLKTMLITIRQSRCRLEKFVLFQPNLSRQEHVDESLVQEIDSIVGNLLTCNDIFVSQLTSVPDSEVKLKSKTSTACTIDVSYSELVYKTILLRVD